MGTNGTKVTTCGVCGCLNTQACEGGCYWVWVDDEHGVGLCSRHGIESRRVPARMRALLLRKRALQTELEELRKQARLIFNEIYFEAKRLDYAW